MRPPFFLSCLLAAALFACAPSATTVLDPAAREQLDAIERRVSNGDDAGARKALDLFVAAHPSGSARSAAQPYENELASRELAPFEPAFAELSAALSEHDDTVAQSILQRVLARRPRGAALVKAQAFAGILAGRRLARALDLSLEAEASGASGTFRVYLNAAHALPEVVLVRCPGSALDFLSIAVDPSGIEQRTQRRVMIEALDELELAPGVPQRIELGTFHVPVGGLVGARGMWRVDTMGGTLERAGRTLPANHIAVGACEVVRLDPRLPTAAVEPAELLDYVERGIPGTAALIERAVRIDAARRDEALDLLTPALLARTLEECERCAPALRWLSGQTDPSASGSNWRRWLSARAESRARRATPALDLPIDGKPFLEQR